MNDTSPLLGAISVIYDWQVSWLTVFGQSRLPACAVTFMALLMTDHSDEFVQEFHLFPFSPAQIKILPAPVKSEHVKILSQGSL